MFELSLRSRAELSQHEVLPSQFSDMFPVVAITVAFSALDTIDGPVTDFDLYKHSKMLFLDESAS